MRVAAFDSPPAAQCPRVQSLAYRAGTIASPSGANAAGARIVLPLRSGPILRRSHKVAALVRTQLLAFRSLPQSRRPMTIFQRVSSLIMLAMVGLAPAAPSQAQDYPSRPVKMIVPFGAGGPSHIFTLPLPHPLRTPPPPPS